MQVLIAIALKSLLVAGLTLGALQLLRSRSAAERSWVAHVGLLALIIIASAPMLLPSWNVEAPALFAQAPARNMQAVEHVSQATPVPSASPSPVPVQNIQSAGIHAVDPAMAMAAIYAVPAALLLIVTLLALARLFMLRARAEVLVDTRWLSALARAQRRMGFKHGTALLTSNELSSPISWGLMRPVILLNERAVEASGEAEAIISHELAHVARMDWIKLLLARIATALFWFNPLVWLLAREAHQLREEAADDSVLAANIVDTDYAELLVGVARHECSGLLLGAHGVAPSRNSLARRVARVLDGKSVRGPVARSFALGVFVGAVVLAAPLAALAIAPRTPKAATSSAGSSLMSTPMSASASAAPQGPADLPHLIATGVSASVASATAAFEPYPASRRVPHEPDYASSNGATVARSPSGAVVLAYPPDRNGRRRLVAIAPDGAQAVTYADGADMASSSGRPDRPRNDSVETAIEMKAVGMTPEYAASIRAASPGLRNATLSEIIELKAVGATPGYIREIASAGYTNLGPDEVKEAYAVGLTPDYMRAIRATRTPVTLNDLIELRALGISADELARVPGSGPLRLQRVRQLHGMRPRPRPPEPPQPPVDDSDDG